jgi:hypothetical protein
MCERALQLAPYIDEWIEKEIALKPLRRSAAPNGTAEADYRDLKKLRLSRAEWNHLQAITRMLQSFKKATSSLSINNRPWIQHLWLMYNRLFDFLDDMNEEVGEDTAQVDNIGWPDIVRAAAEKGRAKLSKYYSKTGGEQGYLFNCAAVLDPTQKLTVYEVSYYSILSQSRADRGTRMTRGVLKTGIPTTRNSFNI